MSQFGWSWASPKHGKTCQEKTTSAHPCDKTLFPDAAPLADAACDVLQKAPFTVCHHDHILDMETGMANCKHDVCSCHDSHCSCPVIKALIEECQEGDNFGHSPTITINNWRDLPAGV